MISWNWKTQLQSYHSCSVPPAFARKYSPERAQTETNGTQDCQTNVWTTFWNLLPHRKLSRNIVVLIKDKRCKVSISKKQLHWTTDVMCIAYDDMKLYVNYILLLFWLDFCGKKWHKISFFDIFLLFNHFSDKNLHTFQIVVVYCRPTRCKLWLIRPQDQIEFDIPALGRGTIFSGENSSWSWTLDTSLPWQIS